MPKPMHQTERPLRHAGAVDADGHILEPPDLWETYIDPKHRDRALRFAVDDNGLEDPWIGSERSLISRNGFPPTTGPLGTPDLRPMPLDPQRPPLHQPPLGT